MYEALIHRLLKRHLHDSMLSENAQSQLDQLRALLASSETDLATCHAQLEADQDLNMFINEIFQQYEQSDMAKYWITFLEMVEVLMMNMHSLRSRNWEEFKSSLRQMLPWLQIYDNDKYGRWLPDFWSMLCTLPTEQEEFLASGMFAQSMSGNPYSALALDIWIETTMNKGSKMKSGWLSILKNEKQLLANTRNVNNILRVRACVQNDTKQASTTRKHAECTPTRMESDEQAIQDLNACFEEFECDPFDLATPTLRTLQSGIAAPEHLVADFQSALNDGEEKLNSFMEGRVYSKSKNLQDRIHRSSRLNFEKARSTKQTPEDKKIKSEQMENKAMSEVISLVEKSGAVEFSDIMANRITEESLALFNVNGTMRKVQKSKLLEKMTMSTIDSPTTYTAIVDMGFIWRLATPTTEDREKGDETKYLWADYAEKIVKIVLSRHSSAETIICVNDPYCLSYSIKDCERQQRTMLQGTVPNVFMKSDDSFPSLTEFKTIMCGERNKQRLQNFLKDAFSKVSQQVPQILIYCVGNRCTNLKTGEEVCHFKCEQSEADTAMFTIYGALRDAGYTEAVMIDSEDTDVYVQAAYFHII